MKLTASQIQSINVTLINNGVVYADIKLELIDHIASEIEQQIEDNNSNFEVAFPIVFNKWKKLLKPTSNSLWLGNFLNGPKVVVDKWVCSAKRNVFFIFIYALFFSVLLTIFFQNFHQEKFISIVNNSIRGLFLLTVILTSIGIIAIKRSKIKTTYRYLFMRRSFLAFIFFYLYGYQGKENFHFFDFNDSYIYNFFGVFLMACFFLIPFFNLKLVLEHFKTIKKYKLI